MVREGGSIKLAVVKRLVEQHSDDQVLELGAYMDQLDVLGELTWGVVLDVPCLWAIARRMNSSEYGLRIEGIWIGVIGSPHRKHVTSAERMSQS